MILDRFGPKITGIIGSIIYSFGCAGFAVSGVASKFN
jgi:hypothetical protein